MKKIIIDDSIISYKDRILKYIEDNKIECEIVYGDDMYRVYEYTDKCILISDRSQYPSMINYVRTGLLTEEEMIEALFI